MKSRKCVTVVEFYRGAVLKLLEFEEILILERHSMIPCEVNKYGPSLTKTYCLYDPRCIM